MARLFGPDKPLVRNTARRKAYLNGKKTDRKNVKHEQSMQIEACQWLRDTFPGMHFYSDTGAGAFNSQYEKDTHNKQQSAKGLPDMTIFAMRRGYGALCLELKTDDAKIKRKRDATKLWVRKNKNGKVIERDTHIRKAGEWYDPHIERQHDRQLELRALGYCATFVQGLEQFKKIVCWYFDTPYIENSSLF